MCNIFAGTVANWPLLFGVEGNLNVHTNEAPSMRVLSNINIGSHVLLLVLFLASNIRSFAQHCAGSGSSYGATQVHLG